MPETPKKGRPSGTETGRTVEKHTLTFTPADWLYCLKQPGGASIFLRELVAQHRKKGEGK